MNKGNVQQIGLLGGALFLWAVCSMLLPPIPYVLAMASLASLALVLDASGRKRLKGVALFMLPLALGFVLVHGTIIYSEGQWDTLGKAKALWALGLWLRILSVIAASQLYLKKVPAPQLVRYLLASSLPVSAAFILAAPTLLLEQIKIRFAQIQEAQLARGVPIKGTLKERVSSLMALLFPLILGLLSDLPDRSAALDSKAFKLFPYRNSLLRDKDKQRIYPRSAADTTNEETKPLIVQEGIFYAPMADTPLLAIEKWELSAGEWVLIRGGNGSGKSTLGQILSGGIPEHRPGKLAGTWQISGVPLSEKEALAWSPHTQLVQQNPSLCYSGCTFTVQEEIAFGLENVGHAHDCIRERVLEALAIAMIPHLADRLLLELSGGEAQKVLLAASIAMRPKILILDEAFSRISYRDIVPILENIKKWSAQHAVAVILLERNGEQAASFCTQFGFLNDGKLQWNTFAPQPERLAPCLETRSADRDDSHPLLRLKEVAFSWNQTEPPLLSDINVQVYAKERIVLLGANGAGKSTLFRLCAGLLSPSGGDVLMGEQPVDRLLPQERTKKIGFLFQEPERQIFRPTVQEEILFSLRNEPLSPEQKQEQLQAILLKTGLKGKGQKHPLDLNSAERRMVAVASLSICNPSLFLLDEPTRELDVQWMELFSQWLQTVDAAVLAISHDPTFVENCFHTSWVLKDGKIQIKKC